jgi:hypothetical protein
MYPRASCRSHPRFRWEAPGDCRRPLGAGVAWHIRGALRLRTSRTPHKCGSPRGSQADNAGSACEPLHAQLRRSKWPGSMRAGASAPAIRVCKRDGVSILQALPGVKRKARDVDGHWSGRWRLSCRCRLMTPSRRADTPVSRPCKAHLLLQIRTALKGGLGGDAPGVVHRIPHVSLAAAGVTPENQSFPTHP